MVEQITEHLPTAGKLTFVAGLLRVVFLWATAYPLLLIERRKNKALVEAITQLEEIVDRSNRLVEPNDL